MNVYKYNWTRHYGIRAQVAGEIIQRCKSVSAVLREASKRSCPLHPLFEWNNSVAAQRYRLMQAREMVASLRVEVITKDKRTVQVAAFVSTIDKTGFVPALEASVEELDTAEKACWREASRFRQKWKSLQFARAIVDAIAATERSVARKRKA